MRSRRIAPEPEPFERVSMTNWSLSVQVRIEPFGPLTTGSTTGGTGTLSVAKLVVPGT